MVRVNPQSIWYSLPYKCRIRVQDTSTCPFETNMVTQYSLEAISSHLYIYIYIYRVLVSSFHSHFIRNSHKQIYTQSLLILVSKYKSNKSIRSLGSHFTTPCKFYHNHTNPNQATCHIIYHTTTYGLHIPTYTFFSI